MNINVVIGAFASIPPAPAGAVEKVWNHLTRSFAAAGHEDPSLEEAFAGYVQPA